MFYFGLDIREGDNNFLNIYPLCVSLELSIISDQKVKINH